MNLKLKKADVYALLAGAILLFLLAGRARADENSWPREITRPKVKVVIYQPQPEQQDGDQLTVRAAVAVTPVKEDTPIFGAVWLRSRIRTDRDTRMVSFVDIKVTQMKFPGVTKEHEAKLAALLEGEIPKWNLSMSQDRLLPTLELLAKEQANAADLKSDPPRIIYSKDPAVLVILDGDPRLSPLADSTLMQVVNTPYFIVFDTASKTYYLNGDEAWFSTNDLKGNWSVAENPPAAVIAQARAGQSPASPKAKKIAKASADKPPRIIVATEPTELIVTGGAPSYTPLVGGDLLYVSNTDSNLFMETATRRHFLLLSGRWYVSTPLDGPWAYLPSDMLPACFANIPPDSPQSAVLASVPGTVQAQDAVMDTQIPQTAEVDRKTATAEVSYDGAPKFEPIAQTGMTYAVNTPDAVIMVGNRYYCCKNAVWYESAKPASGWMVCVSVPRVIYTIPPSYPVYPVRYVYVYSWTPTTVCVGYTAGYVGGYVFGRTVVYGTGYAYRPWVGALYYPRPVTWGFQAAYHPSSGSWGYRAGYVSPGGRYGVSVGYVKGPHGGSASWAGAGWWGPGGYHGYRHVDYNHGKYPQPKYYGGSYKNGDVNIKRGDVNISGNTINRNVTTNNLYRNQANVIRNNNLNNVQARPAARPRPNNIMVDKSGNVLRHTDAGWQQRQGNRWSQTQPASGSGNLNRPSTMPANKAGGGNLATQPRPAQLPAQQPVTRPQPSTRPATSASNFDTSQLNREYQARQRGETREIQLPAQRKPSHC